MGVVLRRNLTPAIAEAVFCARQAASWGRWPPKKGPRSSSLRNLRRPALDAITITVIRQELFEAGHKNNSAVCVSSWVGWSHRMLLHAIRRYPLFNVLPPAWLKVCLNVAETVPVEMGETLFQANTPGRYAYLVETGRVRVLQVTAGGREISLGPFGPGELFGEYALVPPGLNVATCRVSSPGRLVRLPLPAINTALRQVPNVRRHLKNWLRLHALLAYDTRAGLPRLHGRHVVSAAPRSLYDHAIPSRRCHSGRWPERDRWFVVLSGKVLVHSLPGEDSGERVHELGPGDCFGEPALLEGKRLSAARTCGHGMSYTATPRLLRFGCP